MPKMGQDTARPDSKQIQFLENKVNKLRYINNELNKQIFMAIQRGHRLAAKLGYQDIQDAENDLATQPKPATLEAQQSQLEQLSQCSSGTLASYIQELQSELASHITLSKNTSDTLGEALNAITELKGENEKLREELEKVRVRSPGKFAAQYVQKAEENDSGGPHSLSCGAEKPAHVLAELAALKEKYAALEKAKKDAEDKHQMDYTRWKTFKQWLDHEMSKKDQGEGVSKRRKLNPAGDDHDKETLMPPKRVRKAKDKGHGGIRKALSLTLRSEIQSRIPDLEPLYPKVEPAVLNSRNTNLPSVPSSGDASMSKPVDVAPTPVKREVSSTACSSEDKLPSSSDTESDSRPVVYLYPSQLDVPQTSSTTPSTVIRKRPLSPVQDRGSSETEAESQVATFLFPSQIVPSTPAQEKTCKADAPAQYSQQFPTPVSNARPPVSRHMLSANIPPPSSPTPGAFQNVSSSASESRKRPPETPLSRKGKERAVENDENVPIATGPTKSGKKHPIDYSIYKGRGRYGLQAAKKTINSMYEINPERNEGVGFQFEEVVRDKDKRKQLHGGDCECCRDYYRAVGPLPPRAQPPMWRSPGSSPSRKPVQDRMDQDDESPGSAAIEEHQNAVSRHREQWKRSKEALEFWCINFPTSQQVKDIRNSAERLHAEKEAKIAKEANRGGKYRKR